MLSTNIGFYVWYNLYVFRLAECMLCVGHDRLLATNLVGNVLDCAPVNG
jgi:hypothetical protein